MPLSHVGDHHLGHRGFARTAYGDIADADDRNIELLLFQNPQSKSRWRNKTPTYKGKKQASKKFDILNTGL